MNILEEDSEELSREEKEDEGEAKVGREMEGGGTIFEDNGGWTADGEDGMPVTL
jgi:hypothetical protein